MIRHRRTHTVTPDPGQAATPDVATHRAPRVHLRIPGIRRSVASLVAVALGAGAFVAVGTMNTSFAATDGTLVLANMTRPGGGVWLPGPNGTPGHFWATDNVLGICRVDPAAAGGFTTSHCNGTAKAGAQAVYDATRKLVYVADASSKSVQVVRFQYDEVNENIVNPLAIQVPNVTAVGGGSGGGRAASVALSPDGKDLYVGYIKSGDVMKVPNAATATVATPPVVKVGTTSDGRGSSGGFAMFTHADAAALSHSDLYVGEIGGFGMSVIADITGVKDAAGTVVRAACGSPSVCIATTVTNAGGQTVTFFPGGLVTNGTVLYVGNAPPNIPGTVQRFNPTTGVQDAYSVNVPAYTSTFDGVTRTQYQGLTGIGVAPNGDLYVGDDPTVTLATPPLQQGHLWRVPAAPVVPTVTAISPTSGSSAGGTVVTITGTNLSSAAGATTVAFGANAATAVSCAGATSCTATSPAGTGVVDVRVTAAGITSAVSAVDHFTYVTPPPSSAISVTGISPTTGLAGGATIVTITGTNLTDPAGGATTVTFGANAATAVSCASATTCTATSPAGTGTVDVQVTAAGQTSPAVAADRFTYASPLAGLWAYGVTAPKGGMVFIPGNLGGHYWATDHSQGMCRLDPVAGTTLHAMNSAVCDPGFTIGSPGQAVYDPTANADGTHWVYVPDNAVKSPGVWRLTFDPVTETIGNPVALAQGTFPAGLKPNGLALGPDHGLYVGDLVDGNIRRINNPGGDPRTQTVDVVAVTQAQKAGGASRGINGTMAFLGNNLYLPENNAATFFDVTAPCAAVGTLTPCATTSLPLTSTPTPVFVAGMGSDPANGFVYVSSSPGGANATIYRYNPATGAVASVYVTSGVMPAAGTPEATVWCTTTCTRPIDPATPPGATTGFFFAQGLLVDTTGTLYITEDATAGARGGRGHIWSVPFVP